MQLDNPVLSELDSLSPHAKSALAQAHGKLLTLNTGGAPLAPAPPAETMGAPKLPTIGAPQQQAPAPGMLPNLQYAKPGPYATTLPPDQEQGFQSWVKQNNVPFDPSPNSDYDMRGYYQANQGKMNGTQVSGFDGKLHYPDTYKTPYHKTFSNESEYATPDAPHWQENRLIDKSGNVVADETPKPQPSGGPSAQPPSAPAGMLPTIGGPQQQQPQQSPGMLPTLPQPSPTVAGDRAELSRLNTTGSGVSQIHNPFLKTLGVIGDAVGTGLFPRIAAQIPGTTAHHQQLIGEDSAKLKADEGVETEAAKNQETAAQANQYNAHADSLENPAENVQPITTDEGIYGLNRKTGGVNPLSAPGGEPLKPPAKPKTLQHIETDQGIFSLDPSTGALTPLTFNGQPLKGKQPRDAANKTVQLEIGGKPHTVMVDDSGNVVKDLGATGEKPPTVNVNANTSALDRESSRFAKAHEKSLSDADAQLEKIADARAMVNGNAESQALGIPKVLTALVSGAGSGVRITQPELNAIAKARGVQGDFEGFVNKISGKGSLTDQQKQQLTQILDDVHTRILNKRGIASDALDAINGAGSRDEVIKADKIARQKLTDIATGGGANTHASGDEMITVQVPGHQPGQIHASQKAQFVKDFPNAVFPKGK